ncbi:Hypothetical protein PHPALM_20316 [Phytophthora palmivora]|uniref:Secreted RxLR effector peptide protein n=1 Tax=Phytophthora palmivora TaxID=4796 RepID=A0A2P4XF71_9STRA|nr:Hypothetical protein PHPALM_20316 [Phytophthora palmivora]
MRLTFFLTLLLVTFIVDFISAENVFFVKNVDNGFRRLRVSADVQEERGASESVAKLISGLKGSGHDTVAKLQKILASNPALKATDEEVAKVSILVKKANAGDGIGFTDVQMANLAKNFASLQKQAQLSDEQVYQMAKVLADAKRLEDVIKLGDGEVAKVIEMFKKASAGAGGVKFADDELASVGRIFAVGQKRAGLSDDQVSKLSKMFSEADMADDIFKATDDEVAKMSVLVKKANAGDGVGLTDDQVAGFAMIFASAQRTAQLTDDQAFKLVKLIVDAKRLDDIVAVSDDEAAKVIEMFKKANAGASGVKFTDDELVNMGRVFAGAQKRASLSDDQVNNLVKLFTEAKKANKISDESVTKLSQELVPVAKDKKSWSTMKKVIVGTLGATVGIAVIAGVVKLASRDSTTPPPDTATASTSGSA